MKSFYVAHRKKALILWVQAILLQTSDVAKSSFQKFMVSVQM